MRAYVDHQLGTYEWLVANGVAFSPVVEAASGQSAPRSHNVDPADMVRQLHANKKQVPLWPLAKARANKTPVDWSSYVPPTPRFIGRRVFKNYDLAELAR